MQFFFYWTVANCTFMDVMRLGREVYCFEYALRFYELVLGMYYIGTGKKLGRKL